MKPESTTDTLYDAIVIGVGSMGSAALYELAKRGLRVLGLEQFEIVHKNGSHSGETRVIRKAYFEHPDYVPLLERAYDLWDEIEDESGEQLVYKTGLASIGNPEHPAIFGTRKSAELYNVPIREQSFSQFCIPESYDSLFEEDAGFVLSEKAIKTFEKQAIAHGAVVKDNVQVKNIYSLNEGVEVITSEGTYLAKKVICTSGAYTSKLIPYIKDHLKVTRQLLAWVKPKDVELVMQGNFPCWFVADDNSDGMFYGFPVLNKEVGVKNSGLKIGIHIPGPEVDPKELHNYDSKRDEEKIRAFMDTYMPGIFESFISVESCLYTYSPDGHFILDYLPGSEQKVIFAAGFSGHGFKFTPVIGEVLADFTEKGSTAQPVDFLKLDRFE